MINNNFNEQLITSFIKPFIMQEIPFVRFSCSCVKIDLQVYIINWKAEGFSIPGRRQF